MQNCRWKKVSGYGPVNLPADWSKNKPLLEKNKQTHTHKNTFKNIVGTGSQCKANIIEHNRDTLLNRGELILFKHQKESRGKQTLGQLHLKVLLTTMSFVSRT